MKGREGKVGEFNSYCVWQSNFLGGEGNFFTIIPLLGVEIYSTSNWGVMEGKG